MIKNNKLIIILIIFFGVIVGSYFIKNTNKEDLLIINNTNKNIQNILLQDNHGTIIDKISELKSNSEEKIDLKNREYISLLYNYNKGQSADSFVVKDKNDKKKEIKIIINAIYENGKLDIEVK